MKQLFNRPLYRYGVIAIGCISLISLIYLFTEGSNDSTFEDDWHALGLTDNEPEVEEIEIVPAEVVVDVKGAVAHPGVYTLPAESRVYEVIEKAGGFLVEANQDAVNLALRISDELIVFVPKEGEETEALPLEINQSSHSNDQEDKVDLNSATEVELQTLSGIGPSKAASIISHRDEHGPFSTIEDLMQVSGIGEKSFESLKESIIVK
ncbi:late competence protein ComEA, DNA receptor [Bacillus sp. JCM 19046]|nr:late competence protein ComEA, DNA receptor [Bacillus sp. JCM 19045]GAF17965.1 late competence protein ComEA, DNA receptor [Bacillus sp. JCM 19046]